MEAKPTTEDVNHKKKRTIRQFFKKYLWEGQALDDEYQKQVDSEHTQGLPLLQRMSIKYRRVIGMAIPAMFFQFFWLAFFIKFNQWHLFSQDGNYRISIMAIFGSMIAGMTSEGGGSVFFPVMTLALSIPPAVARDFSMNLQSFGMGAAMFAILWMRIRIEWRAIILCSFGGIFGTILSLEDLDARLTPPVKKMGFVSLFFAFAFALFLLNRIHKRTTFKIIPLLNWWKVLLLIFTGFIGGIFTGLSGTGLDVCCFSILTLLFRVTEKTATPTSVVLMAINSMFGMYWKNIMMTPNYKSWEYVGVSVPIVVVGAPLGSVIGSHFHRQTLASLNYITDTVALVSGFAIVPLDDVVIGVAVGIVIGGFLFYGLITYLGGRMMKSVLLQQEVTKNVNRFECVDTATTSSSSSSSLDTLKHIC